MLEESAGFGVDRGFDEVPEIVVLFRMPVIVDERDRTQVWVQGFGRCSWFGLGHGIGNEQIGSRFGPMKGVRQA